MPSVGEYLFYQTRSLPPGALPAPVVQPVVVPQMPRRIFIREIVMAVSKITGVTPDAMESERKFQEYTRARWAVMLLASELTNAGPSDIARCLGGKNHATVIHGVKSAQELLDGGDPDFCATIKRARAMLCYA